MEMNGRTLMSESFNSLHLTVYSCSVLLCEPYTISILLSCEDLDLISYCMVIFHPQNLSLCIPLQHHSPIYITVLS